MHARSCDAVRHAVGGAGGDHGLSRSPTTRRGELHGVLAEATAPPLDVEARPADSVVSAIDVYDVRFSGHGGARIAAWMLVPPRVAADTPVVAEFVGYGGGRGRPAEWLNSVLRRFPSPRDGLAWPRRGLAQGRHAGRRRVGRTGGSRVPDERLGGGLRRTTSRGCSSTPPGHSRWSRRSRTGRPQGGGDRHQPGGRGRPGCRPTARRRPGGGRRRAVPVQLPPGGGGDRATAPYRRDQRLLPALPRTGRPGLCHAVLLRRRRSPPAGCGRRPCSVRQDSPIFVTPPSTVFSAFNHYAGAKAIEVYEFNGHDGAAATRFERKVEFVRGLAD